MRLAIAMRGFVVVALFAAVAVGCGCRCRLLVAAAGRLVTDQRARFLSYGPARLLSASLVGSKAGPACRAAALVLHGNEQPKPAT